MNRKQALEFLINSYNTEEEKIETQKKKKGNLLTFLLKRFIRMIGVKMMILLSGLFFFILILVIIVLFLTMGSEKDTGEQQILVNGEYGDFSQVFSTDMLDIPIGIPVERGRLTRGFDYINYKSSIVKKFLKLNYIGTSEYYEKHQGVDFGKTFMDKIKGYTPTILSTSRGILYEYEDFWESSDDTAYYTYNKYLYNNGGYLNIQKDVKKSISSDLKQKPYGKHVIISTLDGKFYIMFAHMSEVNSNLITAENVDRGTALGKMGDTGNSTAFHLHYEIRFCGNDNETIQKVWKSCYPINPLGFVGDNDFTYLGLKEMPASNSFTAGNIDLKDVVTDQNTITDKYNKEKENFCGSSNIYFVGKDVKCEEVFPIYSISKDISLYPDIIDIEEQKRAGEMYINEEYQNIDLSNGNLQKIKNLEGLKENIKNKEDLFISLGKKLSFGKFQNKGYVFKKRDYSFLTQKEIIELEFKQLNFLIDTLEKMKKRASNPEQLYLKYFFNSKYLEGGNPYVYNFIDKNRIFMDIKDSSGKNIGKYNKDGVLTIYNQLK